VGVNNSEKLIDFVTDLVGEEVLKIDEDLGSGFFRLQSNEAERRQALQDIKNVEDCLVELLRNSRDAGSSRIFVSINRDRTGCRYLRVIDDGVGIPKNMHEKIFEPRVTSRLENPVKDSYGIHGRGMALFSIKSSPAEHKLLVSAPRLGSVFSLNADTSKLTERRDQSTFPNIKREGDEIYFSGPHNIPRVMTEFAIYHPDIALFLGTPAEIISAMVHESNKIPPQELLKMDELPFWRRPAAAINAAALSTIAKTYFDADISLRNAHRILSGEIAAPGELIEAINHNKPEELSSFRSDSSSIYMDNRNYTKNISSHDKEAFSQAIKENFRKLGEKYFIKSLDEPKIRYGRKKIEICFFIEADKDSET